MESTARPPDPEVLEVERPPGIDVGRLQLLGFPIPYRPVSVETRVLELATYDEATAVSIPSGGSGRKDVGGAYDREGRLILDTERAKPLQGWWPTPREIPAGVHPIERYEGRTFYGGRYVGHFGHILLETMTRFWMDLDYAAYDQFVFIPKFFKRGRRSSSSGLMQMLVGLVGVPADKIVIAGDEGVSLERLEVAPAPFDLAIWADPRFLQVFDRLVDRVVRDADADPSAMPSRIYLSRSALDDGRPKGQHTASNELAAEAFFAERGFTIVHPQKLPFTEQAALARHADVIAGCNGSALHLAMFARPGTGLLALDIRHVANQYLIDRARGLNAVHVWARTDDSADWQSPWTIDMDRVAMATDALLGEGTPQARDR